MVQFYDAVRRTLEEGVKKDEPEHEYEALAYQLLDDVLDKDTDRFFEAVSMVIEIAGYDALMRFYDTVAQVMPQIAPECKKAANEMLIRDYDDLYAVMCRKAQGIKDNTNN